MMCAFFTGGFGRKGGLFEDVPIREGKGVLESSKHKYR